MGKKIEKALRVVDSVLLAIVLILFLSSSVQLHVDLEADEQMDMATNDLAFDFTTWETATLWDKFWYSLLVPHHLMPDEAQAEFFLQYMDDVYRAQSLERDLQRIFTDPEVDDPQVASAEIQAELSGLRDRINDTGLMAEAILAEQVSAVLVEGGFGGIPAVLPPVQGRFTPLPYLLVVSPRDEIASYYQQQLIAGLTAADQERLETMINEQFPDYIAYTTSIGGLAAYPAMLLESSSLDWVADVMAHEWTHHYLMFGPLGWQYMKSGEARTINETTASLMGGWAGQEVVLRFYKPLLSKDKRLPDPAILVEDGEPSSPPVNGFDFRAEMRRTRVNVDAMLEAGEIERAELYMEVQRRYFVANGYNLRVLNQAYFAFHGAYADTPGGTGASGKDPLGPAVRELWSTAETPYEFVRQMVPLTSLDAVLAQMPQ